MVNKIKNQKIFLGVDGGATKSTLVLINEKNEKIFKVRGDGLNYRTLRDKYFVKNLASLLLKIKKSHKGKIAGGYFGLAGIDNSQDRQKVDSLIRKIPKKLLPFPFFVVNDVEIILPTVDAENGIAVICGSGSNFYAKNEKKIAFASGLDYLLSDEAGAFDIGIRVLRAAVKSFDKRGKKTILESLVLKRAGTKKIRHLPGFIYNDNSKMKIASFAILIEEALEKGDKVAKEILNYASDEIFLGIEAVSKRVGFKDNFRIVVVGGVFNNRFLVNKIILEAKKRFKKVQVTMVPEPEIGAAKLAKNKFLKKI